MVSKLALVFACSTPLAAAVAYPAASMSAHPTATGTTSSHPTGLPPANADKTTVKATSRFVNFCVYNADSCTDEPDSCTMSKITGDCNTQLFKGHGVILKLEKNADLSMEFFNGDKCEGPSTVRTLDFDQCSDHVSPHRNSSVFVSHIDPAIWAMHTSQVEYANQMHAAEMNHINELHASEMGYVNSLHEAEMQLVQSVQSDAKNSFYVALAGIILLCRLYYNVVSRVDKCE